jgi:hypothetical protein
MRQNEAEEGRLGRVKARVSAVAECFWIETDG